MNGTDDEPTVEERAPTEPEPATEEPPAAEPEPGSGRRRLYREPEEKKLTGVCGGLADYIGADPTIVRLSVVILVLSIGVAGIVGYIIAAVVMPTRPDTVPRDRSPAIKLPESLTPHVWFALLIAAVVLLGFEDRWWFEAPVVGVALVGVGIWFLLHDRQGTPATAGSEPLTEEKDIFRENANAGSDDRTTLLPEVAPERAHAGPPASDDSFGTALDKTEDESQPVPVPPEPSSSVPDHSAHRAGPQGEVPPPVPPWGFGTSSGSEPPPARTNRPGPGVFVGLLLFVAGITGFLALVDVVDVGAGTAMATVLVAVGIGLVVGAWRGRARALVGIGIPIVALLAIADAADFPLDGGTDDRTVVIDDRAELDDEYELLAGQLRLDLRRAALADDPRTERVEDELQDAGLDGVSLADDVPTVSAEVFVGELVVIVPDGMTVDIDALTSIGDIRSPSGTTEGGIHAERHFVVEAEGGGSEPAVHLDLKMGLGEIEVRRG